MSDSDEESVSVPKRRKLIQHGTLEEHMKKHGRETSKLLEAGVQAGNINISDGEPSMHASMQYASRVE